MMIEFPDRKLCYEARTLTPTLLLELGELAYLMPYHRLQMGTLKCDESEIQLQFDEMNFIISGVSLSPLWIALAKHELSRVSAGTEASEEEDVSAKVTSIGMEQDA